MQKQALSSFSSRSWSSKVKKKKHFTNRWDSNLGLEVTVTVVYILHTSQSGLERCKRVKFFEQPVQQNILLIIFLTCNCTDPLPARLCSEARSEGAVQHRDSRGGQAAVWEWTLPSEGPEWHQLLLPNTCCQVLCVHLHVFVFCSKYLLENVWCTCFSLVPISFLSTGLWVPNIPSDVNGLEHAVVRREGDCS